jgi:hypothetical protein
MRHTHLLGRGPFGTLDALSVLGGAKAQRTPDMGDAGNAMICPTSAGHEVIAVLDTGVATQR